MVTMATMVIVLGPHSGILVARRCTMIEISEMEAYQDRAIVVEA